MSKNNEKTFAILFVICLVALLFIIIIISLNKTDSTDLKSEYSQEDLNIMEDQLSNYLDDKIVPNGLSRMYGKYKGNNEFSDLYRSLYRFVNYLPNTVGKLDEVESDYEKNVSQIVDSLGCKDVEEYRALLEYMSSCGYEGQDYLSCKVMDSDFVTENGFFIVNIGFYFEGLDDPIVIKVMFSTKVSAYPKVKYQPYES